MTALLLLIFFVYPAAAYPLQALMLTLIMVLAAAGLAARLLKESAASRAALLGALGSVPALAGLLFVTWAVARWRFSEVPALEREWIVSLLALALALVLGCAVGALNRSEPARISSFTVLARLVIIGTICFGFYSIYQYFIGYPAAEQALRLETGTVMDPLEKQSMLHALAERRVGGTLGDPNMFAAQLSLFIFISLSALDRESSRVWRGLGALAAGAAFVAVLIGRSRGGLMTALAAAAGAGLLIWMNRRKSGKDANTPGLAMAAILALLALTSVNAQAAHESLAQRIGNIATIRERWFYWEIALKVWVRHPFIGEGPGGYSLLYLTLKNPVARESQFAHSWFFQIGAELGLIGLALFMIFWIGTAVRIRGTGVPPVIQTTGEPPVPQSEAAWCAGGMLVLIFNGLLEFTLQWHAFLVAFGLLAGMAIGLTNYELRITNYELKQARRISGIVGTVLGFAGCIAVLVLGVPFYTSENYRWRGQDAAKGGEPAEAARNYQAALRWLPDNPGLHLSLAGALDRLGDAAGAWRQLDAAQRLNTRSAAIRDAQAMWLARRGQTEQAIAKLGEAIEARYPSNVAYRLDRARLQLQAGRPAEAAKDLAYIEKERLPVWEYQQPEYLKLRAEAGLPAIAVAEIPK